FFFQAEDGIRDGHVTGVQTCALPISGLGAEAAGKLAELGAKEIVYLSCDPSTLARDLAVLMSSPRKPKEIIGPSVRYEIAEMHLFDLFPQTFHIETLVRLRRAP